MGATMEGNVCQLCRTSQILTRYVHPLSDQSIKFRSNTPNFYPNNYGRTQGRTYNFYCPNDRASWLSNPLSHSYSAVCRTGYKFWQHPLNPFLKNLLFRKNLTDGVEMVFKVYQKQRNLSDSKREPRSNGSHAFKTRRKGPTHDEIEEEGGAEDRMNSTSQHYVLCNKMKNTDGVL